MASENKKKPSEDFIDALVKDLRPEVSVQDTIAAAENNFSFTGEHEFSEEPAATPLVAEAESDASPSMPVPASVSDDESAAPEPVLEHIEQRVESRNVEAHTKNSRGTSLDATIKQAETLRVAQQRILELEKFCQKLRSENESMTAALETAREREEKMNDTIQNLDRSRQEMREQTQQEIAIFKDNLHSRDSENTRLKAKIEELESRLQSDLKKIRVRERELENRLELSKAEKSAIIKTKDDNVLELRRKLDQLYSEVDKYKQKCQDLNQKIEANNDQFSRTVRALRLALTNLEANESSHQAPALKKVD